LKVSRYRFVKDLRPYLAGQNDHMTTSTTTNIAIKAYFNPITQKFVVVIFNV